MVITLAHQRSILLIHIIFNDTAVYGFAFFQIVENNDNATIIDSLETSFLLFYKIKLNIKSSWLTQNKECFLLLSRNTYHERERGSWRLLFSKKTGPVTLKRTTIFFSQFIINYLLFATDTLQTHGAGLTFTMGGRGTHITSLTKT